MAISIRTHVRAHAIAAHRHLNFKNRTRNRESRAAKPAFAQI
jgi:hypothetical protein